MNRKQALKFLLFLSILIYFSVSALAQDTQEFICGVDCTLDGDCSSDGDKMADSWESYFFTDIYSPTTLASQTADYDKDGVNNGIEYMLCSNPLKNNSDSDLFNDTIEYYYGTNLTDTTDYPTYSLNNITLAYPRFGVSSVKTFDLVVRTSNASACKRSTNPNDKYDSIVSPTQFLVTDDSYNHSATLTLTEGIDTKLYIYCRVTKSGYKNDMFPKEISLKVDTSDLKILSVDADPNPVIETLKVTLTAETDDDAVCRFVNEEIEPEETDSLFQDVKIADFSKKSTQVLTPATTPPLEDAEHYDFVTLCMSKSEKIAVASQLISFDVNLSAKNRITELKPSGFIRASSADITVVTNRDTTCRYGTSYVNAFQQKDTKVHYYTEQNLSNKKYSIPILCQFPDGESIESNVEFTVDTVPPSGLSITAEKETCDNGRLNATFTAQDSSNFVLFHVSLVDSAGKALFSKNTTEKIAKADSLNLTRGSTYYWEITAVDIAGNNASKKRTDGTKILLPTDVLCAGNKAPYIQLTPKLTEEGISLTLNCRDPDAGDTCTLYYHLMTSSSQCDSCAQCTFTKYISTTQVKTAENATLCYNITDNRKMNVLDSIDLKIGRCTSNATCCMGKQASYCTSNCTIVTDLACNPNAVDTDKDLINDVKEIECGLDPNNATDASKDSDGDGLSNKEECLTYKTDIFEADTDGDGYDDGAEVRERTDPKDPEDFPVDPDKDTDGDGIKDAKEEECGLDPDDPDDAAQDTDGDGLTNRQECMTYKTDFKKEDTDGDGYSDKEEIDKKTNPNKSTDFPKSHILNIILFILGIPLLLGGLFLFLKNSPKSGQPKIPRQAMAKPLVDFNKAQKQMGQQGMQRGPMMQMGQQGMAGQQSSTYLGVQQGYQQPVPSQPVKLDLDYELKKKREELRFRKMSSVFDEFSEQPSSVQSKQEKVVQFQEKKKRQSKRVLDRLDDVSEDNVFEELERIEKEEMKKR